MRFWIRELGGWVLIALGLFVFYCCFLMLNLPVPRFVATGPMIVIGIFVFRGGIHLLKVAVAARVCVQVQEQLERDRPTPRRSTVRTASGS
jgi:hypothetical protein